MAILAEYNFPGDEPFVQGWAAAVEWTNVELERDDAGGRYKITPIGQMLSTTEGLGAYLTD